MAKAREVFAGRFGFFAASTALFAGVGTMTLLGFRAIAWGSGAFMLWFVIGYIFVSIPIYLVDSALGYWSRKAGPQTWAQVSKGNKFFEWLIWFTSTNGQILFVTFYVALIGIYLNYAIGTPFKFWGASPGGFFYDQYGITLNPLGFGILLWLVAWFVMYRSVNTWVRFAIWAKPVTTVILLVLFVWTLSSFPTWPSGWGQTFEFSFAKFFGLVAFTQAMLWVFWRAAPGIGNITAFASYLPKGSDMTTTVTLSGIWDIAIIVLAALTLPTLALGAGVPPVFAGSIGLAFGGLPRAWAATAPVGLLMGVVFYLIAIPSAFPLMVAYTESYAAALMDEFGWPRSRVMTLLFFLVGIPLLILYTLPIYDPVNGNSWGFTLIFAAIYWESLLPVFGVIGQLIMVKKYFGFDKVVDILNEASIMKLSKTTFKVIISIAFIISATLAAYVLLGTLGLPGVNPYDVGTLLGDGTSYHFLEPAGIGILFMQVGIPALLGLWIVLRKR